MGDGISPNTVEVKGLVPSTAVRGLLFIVFCYNSHLSVKDKLIIFSSVLTRDATSPRRMPLAFATNHGSTLHTVTNHSNFSLKKNTRQTQEIVCKAP